MKFSTVIPLILGAALQAVAQVSDAALAAELVKDLKNAPTQVARLNILKNNRDVSTGSSLVTSPLTVGRGSVAV
jgi:hypothetical protein